MMTTAMDVYAQLSKSDSDLEYIEAKMKKLKNYRQDFLDFTKPRNNEFENIFPAQELTEVALNVDGYLNSAWSLVYIYSNLSCVQDKAMVGSLAKMQVAYYAKMIEVEIKGVNRILSTVKTPALAASGVQLRDDLRETIDRLESIKFN